MTDLRVLFYDIETSPSLAFIWSPRDEYIPMDRLVHDTFLLNWGAKWRGDRQVIQGLVTPEEARAQDDSRIVRDLADLLRLADIVVAHNGDRFDLPKLNGRLLQMGLEPLGPIQTIDTLKLAKRALSIHYNKLDYLGEFLGLGRKVKTDFDLWRQCYQGDEKALAKMEKYNRQDVVLLEKIFEALKPYVNGLPRLVEGTGHICPSCGSDNLARSGTRRTGASTFQRWWCNDCGRYSRGRTALPDKIEMVPL